MKSITTLDRAVDKIILDGIKTLMATYAQTKLAGVAGGASGILDWATAEKIFVKRALAKNRRGATGFGGDMSSIGQIP